MIHSEIPRWLQIAWAVAAILTSVGGGVMLVIWLRDRREFKRVFALIEKAANKMMESKEAKTKVAIPLTFDRDGCPICGSHSNPCDCGSDDTDEGDYDGE